MWTVVSFRQYMEQLFEPNVEIIAEFLYEYFRHSFHMLPGACNSINLQCYPTIWVCTKYLARGSW